MTTTAYRSLQVRPGHPRNTFQIVAVGWNKSETVLDAGLTGFKAREDIRRYSQLMGVPIQDASEVGMEKKWGRAIAM